MYFDNIIDMCNQLINHHLHSLSIQRNFVLCEKITAITYMFHILFWLTHNKGSDHWNRLFCQLDIIH